MPNDVLLTPGPTPLPPQVREALARPMIHHRTSTYRAVFKRVLQGMQMVMQTTQSVVALTSSGTGAMEAAVVNLCSPGDQAIVILGGKFAERWQHLCGVYGVKVITVPVAYGEAVDPQQVARALSEHPQVKTVFATLCETSTGVVHDIRAIAAVTRSSPAVLIVDAISGLGAEACETDAWGIDVLVTGSQKALMLPPGLAFLSLSERAWRLAERTNTPRFYYDLRLYRQALKQADSPFTPGVALIVALDEALQVIRAQGLPQILARCALMAQATRAGAQALGLEVFSKRPANAVTAIRVPTGLDGRELIRRMAEASRVRVAGGQADLAGMIVRIAHMGAITPEDVLAGLAALEEALTFLGHAVDAGVAVRTAQAVFGRARRAPPRVSGVVAAASAEGGA
jgi:aspartate aminotransferase-like enzyme